MEQQETVLQADPRRWLMLAVVLSAALVVALDTFIVNVALPSLQRSLHTFIIAVQAVVLLSVALSLTVLRLARPRPAATVQQGSMPAHECAQESGAGTEAMYTQTIEQTGTCLTCPAA